MSLKKKDLEELLKKTAPIKKQLSFHSFDNEKQIIEVKIYQYGVTFDSWNKNWYLDSTTQHYKKWNNVSYDYKIQELNDIIEHLLTHISYQPGGLGMVEAKNHFEKSI